MGESKRRKQAGEYPDICKKPPKSIQGSVPASPVSWKVMGDLSTHPKANAVLEALESLKAELDKQDLRGNTMRVSLESKPGEAVVIVDTVGLSAFMSVINLFQDLDLVDRLADSDRAEKGIDAAFT